MNILRNVVLTTILTISVFSAVIYTSCKKDKCSNVICLNLGACDGGNCYCPTGYEGRRCDTLARNKFIFTFQGIDSCTKTGVQQYPVRMLANLDKPLEFTMHNLLNNPDDSAICTIQATDSFTFLGANNSTTFYGSGTIGHDSLHIRYHVEHDTTSYDCHYFGQGLR